MSATGVCPHCEAPTRPDQEFCGACGNPLPAGAQPPAAPVGGICPRCGVALTTADMLLACPTCGAPHHQGCFAAQGGCAVHGCPANPLTVAAAVAYPAGAGAYPASAGAYPAAPGAHPAAVAVPSGGPNGWLIAGAVGGGVLVVGLIVAIVLLAAGGGGSAAATTTVVSRTRTAVTPVTPVMPVTPTTSTGGQSTPRLEPPPPLLAPSVTGSDGQYNTGPNCSDNPSSALPGCADSPSTPNGDPEVTCANGITADKQTTSCGLAQNVKAAYRGDGTVIARSPERGRDYAFSCQTGGSGTTHMTICHGQAGTAILYLRWQA